MGSQITMLKLRGWSGLTNNYVKTERLEWAHKYYVKTERLEWAHKYYVKTERLEWAHK